MLLLMMYANEKNLIDEIVMLKRPMPMILELILLFYGSLMLIGQDLEAVLYAV